MVLSSNWGAPSAPPASPPLLPSSRPRNPPGTICAAPLLPPAVPPRLLLRLPPSPLLLSTLQRRLPSPAAAPSSGLPQALGLLLALLALLVLRVPSSDARADSGAAAQGLEASSALQQQAPPGGLAARHCLTSCVDASMIVARACRTDVGTPVSRSAIKDVARAAVHGRPLASALALPTHMHDTRAHAHSYHA